MQKSISLLSYPASEAAAGGNADTIDAVLKNYKRYIATLSTRNLYSDSGAAHLCVDEEMRCRQETKLIIQGRNIRLKDIDYDLRYKDQEKLYTKLRI